MTLCQWEWTLSWSLNVFGLINVNSSQSEERTSRIGSGESPPDGPSFPLGPELWLAQVTSSFCEDKHKNWWIHWCAFSNIQESYLKHHPVEENRFPKYIMTSTRNCSVMAHLWETPILADIGTHRGYQLLLIYKKRNRRTQRRLPQQRCGNTVTRHCRIATLRK